MLKKIFPQEGQTPLLYLVSLAVSIIFGLLVYNIVSLTTLQAASDILTNSGYLVLNPSMASTLVVTLEDMEECVINTSRDLSVLEQKWDAKPRPYPYDTGSTFTVTSSPTTVDTFGSYVSLVPKATFSFGDSPNQIQISGISVESISKNGVYILEFSRSSDSITYTPIGALRFNRTNINNSSEFISSFGGRELNADTETLYARLKSTPVNASVDFSLLIKRHISTTSHIPASTGVFPFH